MSQGMIARSHHRGDDDGNILPQTDTHDGHRIRPATRIAGAVWFVTTRAGLRAGSQPVPPKMAHLGNITFLRTRQHTLEPGVRRME